MYTPSRRRLLAAMALVLFVTSAASAQNGDDTGPDPASVRVRIGPLWMNPSISVPNVGIDTNVFNDPPDVTPKRDFTVTVMPKTELWLRLGRTWLSGIISEEMTWYQKHTTERSANSAYTVGWKAPLNRLVLSTGATWLRARARPGFEIDGRVQRKEPTYTASAEIRALAKTFFGVRGNWRKVTFDDAAVFDGRGLREELDRTERSAAVTVRHDLTPLTSVTFSAGRAEQRFAFSTSRDSTSDDFSVSLNFDPRALLKGSARFGYTDYRPESADLAGYKGATIEMDLAYTLLGSTRFTGGIRRQVESSYDASQPYYLLTGASGSIAQQIFGPVDIVGRISAQRLEYRTRLGAPVAMPDRTDHLRAQGGGVGFRLGQDLRLGFNIDKERRTSVLTHRQYHGLKYGTSLTYGL